MNSSPILHPPSSFKVAISLTDAEVCRLVQRGIMHPAPPAPRKRGPTAPLTRAEINARRKKFRWARAVAEGREPGRNGRPRLTNPDPTGRREYWRNYRRNRRQTRISRISTKLES